MTTTQKDRLHIIQLFDQGCRASDLPKDAVEHVIKQMPHVTVADIVQVGAACKRLVEIMQETQRHSGNTKLNLVEAGFSLNIRAQDGDKHAIKLLDEFNKAMLAIGMAEHLKPRDATAH